MKQIKIPEHCCNCPLKDSLTRHCGVVIANSNKNSAGVNCFKIPNGACLLRGVQIPEKMRGQLEYPGSEVGGS